jgi:hypothetical protein
MDWLDEELKRALERKEPGPDFDARVAERLRRRPHAGSRRWFAIAASVLVLVSTGEAYRWRQGMRAKEQVRMAVRLAAGKLNQVQSQVREVNR